MNTIEKLGDEETFRNIVERTITEFEDNEIEVIGMDAFYNCSALTSVSLPAATSIGGSAFKNCSALTSVLLPAATSIRNYTFQYCSALTSASFPAVTSIGENAFHNCSALTSASFPIATSLGTNAFASCSKLTSISLPAATSIGMDAFYNCKALTSISLPAATSIGDSAFIFCSALTSVSIPAATSIEDSAFRSCKALTSVSVPVATSIKARAFEECSSLTTLYIGTKSNTVCTLSNTNAIPSNVTDIYVPLELIDSYKTATNWSSFADKIKSYEVPVSCQNLTITAEDVPGYKTSTKIHYEAVCTYSIEGILQTGTKVFKGDAVSDTFGTNPSGESSRQVEISYTFLGQTATTTITQDKYLGNPVGGKIYYIDDTADGTYSFYDAEGNLMSNVSVGSTPSYYKVLTAGSKDKYYVYHDEIYGSFQWGKYYTTTGATGTAIGTGKSNTATLLATNAVSDTNTIWYKLQQIRNASTGDCNDWFIPSKDEVEALRLAIGCTTSTSGAVVVDAGAVTGGTLAGTADGKTHYTSYNGTYYCYPSYTKFLNTSIWSSSEHSAQDSWNWGYTPQYWDNSYKYTSNAVFFARAF